MGRSQRIRDWLDEHGEAVQAICAVHGLPWQACVVQGILESGLGRTVLGEVYNLWGISYRKAHHKAFVWKRTREVKGGELVYVRKRFAAFESMEEGVDGYCRFVTRSRYVPEDLDFYGLFQRDPLRFVAWIWGRGYATSRRYVRKAAVRFRWVLDATGDRTYDCVVDAGLEASLETLEQVSGKRRWRQAKVELVHGFGEVIP